VRGQGSRLWNDFERNSVVNSVDPKIAVQSQNAM
jgi:hypothetical protein